MRWILADSGCSAVVVETAEHFTRVDEVHADLPDVGSVWQLHLGDLDKLATQGRFLELKYRGDDELGA